MPAAWITPWMVPKRSSAAVTTARIAASSVTSADSVSTSPPSASITSRRSILPRMGSPSPWAASQSVHSSRTGNGERPTSTSRACASWARCSASSNPRPPRPPVIRQTPRCRSPGAAAAGSGTGSYSRTQRRLPRKAMVGISCAVGARAISVNICPAVRCRAATSSVTSMLRQERLGYSRGMTATGPRSVAFSGSSASSPVTSARPFETTVIAVESVALCRPRAWARKTRL